MISFLCGFMRERKMAKNSSPDEILIVIKDYSCLVSAMKCVLFLLDNKASTTKKIFSYIRIFNDGKAQEISYQDYNITNELVYEAVVENNLILEKIEINGKTIYLYSNPMRVIL
jgi:hypothetical protein